MTMPIGSVQRFYVSNERSSFKQLIKNLYFKTCGIPDLHTHIRWRIIKRFIDLKALSVLDIGCGNGIVSIELSLKNPEMKIIGMDVNREAISQANSIKESLKLKNIEFHHLDAMTSYPYPDNSFEMVLLIDVIEHVQNPEMIIENVSRVLRTGGSVVISVPTPNYPRFFGYKFHTEIGHVRNGYWHEEIERMLNLHGISVTEYSYYTYYPSSLACALFYRYLRKKSKLGMLASPLLNLMSYLDVIWPIRRQSFACSLAVKAQKVI